MINQSLQQHRELFETATLYYKLAPWKYMFDSNVFAVVHPVTGVKAYCTVLGNLEEMLGMVMYLGPKGLKCLKEIVTSEEKVIDYEGLGFNQDGLICFFEDSDNLMPEEMEVLESLGMKVKKGAIVPVFKSYKPGWMPYKLSAEEVEFMLIGLQQALVVCADAGQDPEIASQLGLREDGTVLARAFGNDGEWHYGRISVDSTVEFSPVQIGLEEEEISALKALPRQDKIWLFEHFYFNMPSYSDEHERAFFPKAIVLMEVEATTLVGVDALPPHEFEDGLANVFSEVFVENNYTPQQIVVASRENYILLKSFCKSLEIDLYLDAEMEMVEELRELIMEMFTEDDDADEA